MVVFSLPLGGTCFTSTETPELDTECEIACCKLNIIGCRTLYLGSFYRPPNRKPEIEQEYLDKNNGEQKCTCTGWGRLQLWEY